MMMRANPESRSEDEPGDTWSVPMERFEELLAKFQGSELTHDEANELLAYIDEALGHAKRADRTDVVKKLRIIRRGVEGAMELERQGLHA